MSKSHQRRAWCIAQSDCLLSFVATLAVIQISMYLGSKNTNYFITPACVLPKAYSNSLMALLNNRSTLRQTSECITLHATVPQLPGTNTAPNRPIQVNIDQVTFTDGEHSSTTTVDHTTANSKVSLSLLCRLYHGSKIGIKAMDDALTRM